LLLLLLLQWLRTHAIRSSSESFSPLSQLVVVVVLLLWLLPLSALLLLRLP